MSIAPASQEPHPKPRPSRLWVTFKTLIRARVFAGLATVLPIWLTWVVAKFVFGIMRDASGWVVKAFLSSDYGKPVLEKWTLNLTQLEVKLGHEPTVDELIANLPNHVQWGIAIFSVLLTIFLLYIIGLFTANLFGRRILEALELLVDRVPLVKTVYRASKQVLTTFTNEQARNFQRVVLIPFRDKGTWSIGFITSIQKDTVTGEEICATFVSTTPNPAVGYVYFLKRSELIELDWTIEDAIRLVMSGGILTPGQITLEPKPAASAPRAKRNG